MDVQFAGSIVLLAGAIITGAFAVLGRRLDNKDTAQDRHVTRQGAIIDDLGAQLDRVTKQRDDAAAEAREYKKQRDDLTDALGRTMIRLGTVEAYAQEIEEIAGLPHRAWTERLDTHPQERS